MQPKITEEAETIPYLQRRFIHLGFDGLDEKDIVELIFSLSTPKNSSKTLAQTCLKKYGSLSRLLATKTTKLESIGVPHNTIVCLKLLRELPIQVIKQKIAEKLSYHSSVDIFELLHYSMLNLNEEIFKVIFLDANHHIIDIEDLFVGSRHTISVSPRLIVEKALEHDVEHMIFAHNHTSGDPKPSRTDNIFTKDMVFIGELLKFKILDHIIFGEHDFYSYADSGRLQLYEDCFTNMKIKGIINAENLCHSATTKTSVKRQHVCH